MKKKIILASVFCLFVAFCALAQQLKCDLCGNPIAGHYHWMENQTTWQTNNFCSNCFNLSTKCFACRLPVLPSNARLLSDGRYICPADDAVAIKSEEEAKQICTQTVNDMNRLFARWMEFPLDNALVSIVNRFYLENLFKTHNDDSFCASYYGATTSNPLPDGKMIHSVAILSDLNRAQLMATCAHEFTHAFVGQNHIREKRKTKLGPNMEEGLCELVAHKYMESLHEDGELKLIERNNYTQGKIQVLLAADAKYGFNAILDWFKYGDDASLTLDHLERIRAINGNYNPLPDSDYPASLIPVGSPAKTPPAPTTLRLKSISGAGNRRFAMINSTTFETMEKAKVRLGATSVTVQCLEIKKDSVTIRVGDSAETRQLVLSGD